MNLRRRLGSLASLGHRGCEDGWCYGGSGSGVPDPGSACLTSTARSTDGSDESACCWLVATVIGSGERRAGILARLAEPDGKVGTARLCEVCAEVVGADGAGIMLMSGDVPRGTVATTDAVAARIEDLQFTLGEGPCVDAYHNERPVIEPDLADPVAARWPGFTPGAVAAGVGAIFGFPITVGAVRLGALNLYRTGAGQLSDDQHADALVMAEVLGEALLALQAEAPDGVVGAELDKNANFRHVVAQAAGMVSVQLDGSIGEAMIRLRSYAFVHDRPVDDVAAEVVDRTLRFRNEPPHLESPSQETDL